MTTKPRTKVLFICEGNTCRSPMAEIIFRNVCKRHKRTGVTVRSAGTSANVGADLMPEALIALREAGEKIPAKPHCAKQFTMKMQQQFDYILDLRQYTDPYGRGQAAYDAVCHQLQIDLENLYQQIFVYRTPQPVLS